VEEYERERTKVFGLIIGQHQCSPALRDKELDSMAKFPALEEADNFTGLLKLIHELVYITRGSIST
jgi:hypothetical protein